ADALSFTLAPSDCVNLGPTPPSSGAEPACTLQDFASRILQGPVSRQEEAIRYLGSGSRESSVPAHHGTRAGTGNQFDLRILVTEAASAESELRSFLGSVNRQQGL